MASWLAEHLPALARDDASGWPGMIGGSSAIGPDLTRAAELGSARPRPSARANAA